MYIYIAHCHKVSNALYCAVDCGLWIMWVNIPSFIRDEAMRIRETLHAMYYPRPSKAQQCSN